MSQNVRTKRATLLQAMMPPARCMIIEEELREDAEIFQAYVEKPMMIMRRKEELRIAQEQQEKKDAEEKMMQEMKKIAHYKELENEVVERGRLFEDKSRLNTRGGVSSRLTLLRKMNKNA